MIPFYPEFTVTKAGKETFLMNLSFYLDSIYKSNQRHYSLSLLCDSSEKNGRYFYILHALGTSVYSDDDDDDDYKIIIIIIIIIITLSL